MEVKVIVPSHKRWDKVVTAQSISGIAICVPESQADAYAACNKNIEIITHPDSVVGLLAKRQWILDNFKAVAMIDDDIEVVRRMYVEKGEENELEPDEAYELIQYTAFNAKMAGAYFFGFSNSPDPRFYDSLNPIKMSGWANGCAFGILPGSKLWYNQDIKCNCDYWISALNGYYHRKAWIDTRFYFNQMDTFVARGGQAEFRSNFAEEADFKILQRVFGQNVISLRSNKKNLKHQFQKSLKLPF